MESAGRQPSFRLNAPGGPSFLRFMHALRVSEASAGQKGCHCLPRAPTLSEGCFPLSRQLLIQKAYAQPLPYHSSYFPFSFFHFPSLNSFPLIHLIIYLDEHCVRMVISHLIVRYHVHSLTSPPSQCLWVLSVSALDCSFSFVFFNIQPTDLQTRKRFRPNSFPHNPLSDPHPLNLVVSIFYKDSGGEDPVFPCHPEPSEESAFSLLLWFVASLGRYFNLPKGSTMSPKPNTSASTTVDPYCQHISPKGNRCHMLIDEHRRPANGAVRPTLCAYHADRLRATVPAVDPEALASDLLGDIDDFSTAGSVNLFLGNLVKQLARKRIARRDAVALAYISQLLLNSLPALERQLEAEQETEKETESVQFARRLRERSRELASLRDQPSTNGAAVARPDA